MIENAYVLQIPFFVEHGEVPVVPAVLWTVLLSSQS